MYILHFFSLFFKGFFPFYKYIVILAKEELMQRKI